MGEFHFWTPEMTLKRSKTTFSKKPESQKSYFVFHIPQVAKYNTVGDPKANMVEFRYSKTLQNGLFQKVKND